MQQNQSPELASLVARWRARMGRSGVSPVALDELESHLWDALERGRAAGRSDREAFLEACARLGQEELIGAEFGKGAERRIRGGGWGLMVGSYLKTAWRALRKRPGYAFINVTGLAVGVGCFVLIALFVGDEVRYDRWVPEGERIFRVHETMGTTGEEWASTPMAVADELRAAYGDRVQVARLRRRGLNVTGDVTVRRDERQFVEGGFFYADSTFFDVFALPMAKGDPSRALTDPASIVLTETAAKRYFAGEEPIGQTLLVNDQPFTVTAVLRDLPRHSHLRFDFLAPMHAIWSPTAAEGLDDYWRFSVYYTYAKLAPGAETAPLRRFLNARREEVGPMHSGLIGAPATFRFKPLHDIHLRSHAERELFPNGDIAYVYLFSAAALLLLGVACVNFVNLATARGAERAREVGVRKVLGAHRHQLTAQFVGEAVLLVGAASVAGLGLAWGALPLLNEMTGKALSPGAADAGWAVLLVAGLALGIGLLAGLYPALFLSRFEPVRVLKGQVPGGGGRLRRGLVVAQFAVSTFLIVGTLVVGRQLSYLQRASLGLDRERMLVVPVRNAAKMAERYPQLKAALTALPGVQTVAGSNTVPGRPVPVQYIYLEGASPDEPLFGIRTLTVDYGFLETYGLELASGRDFSEDRPTDTTQAFIFNEAAVRRIGWDQPLGRRANFWRQDAQIIGVVKDFNYASLHDEVEPLVIDLRQRHAYSFVSVKLKAGDVARAVAGVERAWKAVLPDEPFEHFFLDDGFDQLYRNELTLRRTFEAFSALTILVACLGLFGLASFTAQRRTKEIGVRKALGASAWGITALLLREFLKPVAIAFALAAPLAYVALSGWLERFAYRVEIGAGLLVTAGAAALAIAVVTVGYQSLKAARANPVDSLRYE